MPLTPPKTADDLLDMYYLDMRSHLLEVAAALDRIDRAGGTDDPRLDRLREVGTVALGEAPDRAPRILELLSD